MATIETSTTLGALVNEHPELARELERRGLDYCCGGRATLGDACNEAGLDPRRIAAELTAATIDAPASDWTTMDAPALVDHLVATHHRYLWDELPRLFALTEMILSVHGARHPELADVARTYTELRSELEPHLMKEEQILFPMIRELAAAEGVPAFHCGTLRNPISMMLREHDNAGALLARLRMLTNGYTPPADACASYVACFTGLAELEADTHLHIHKENNLLFPMVVRLEAELAAS